MAWIPRASLPRSFSPAPPSPPTLLPIVKEALNWFFKAAREQPRVGDRSTPPPAALDQGQTAWEHRLVQRLRTLHYQWRTEQAYRGWAWRFARALAPRAPEDATTDDLRNFLTRQATEQRASASSQRQAANALVFFFREVLEKETGDSTSCENPASG